MGKRLGIQLIVIVALASTAQMANGQIGGDRSFSFLHLSQSARLTGLGGLQPSVVDDDPIFAWQNPASLNSSAHQAMSFNHSFFPAGIQHSSAIYAQSLGGDTSLTASLGIQYLDYGDFDWADETGARMGTFSAADLAMTLSLSKRIHKNYSVGINTKYAQSQLESYRSSAILFDLGVQYYNPEERWGIGLVAKNLGFSLSRFEEGGERNILPFDLVLGYSKRLKHLPFRYGIVLHHLYRWNIVYDDPNMENNTLFNTTGEDQDPSWVDNFFRHLNFNGEFLLGKEENFRIRLAYSHLLRQELKLFNTQTLSGFSFGFGMKISRFRIDYGRSVYHLAGGIHHFSISTRLSEFL